MIEQKRLEEIYSRLSQVVEPYGDDLEELITHVYELRAKRSQVIDFSRTGDLPDHAKSPWRIERDGHIADANGRAVAVFGVSGLIMDIDRANGVLLAAAPDLLHACQAMLQTLHEVGYGFSDEAQIAREAIARGFGGHYEET